MSNFIDKRNNKTNAQEYAHKYPFEGKGEEYQYSNEDQRVKFHVDSDIDDTKSLEELYNVEIDNSSTIEIKPSNRLKVKVDPKNVLEENKQRSYKIRNTSPIWDKSDPGQQAYELNNNPREDEVNYINQSSLDFETQIEEEMKAKTANFEQGMKVSHYEEGINGEIKFVGKEKIAVVWEDNTRERFNIHEASKYLKLISYVDNTQQQVAPLDTSLFPKNETLSPAVEKALNSLNSEDINNEEEIKKASSMDIEKIKLKRKADELQNIIDNQDIDKIKTKATKELIELMQKKGMVGNSQEEIDKQFNNIFNMDDSSFEIFQTAVLSAKASNNDATPPTEFDPNDVLSVLDEDDYSDIEDGQEYAKAKEEMKKATSSKRTVDGIEMGDTSFFENGGMKNFKPVVGGFGDSGSGSVSSGFNKTESRNLSASNKSHKAIEKKSSSNLDLSGFNNIEGIKQPINIASNNAPSVGGKFSELFGELNWTTTSRRR